MHDASGGNAGRAPTRSTAAAERSAFRQRVRAWRDRWSIEAEVRLAGLCRDQAGLIVAWASALPAYKLAAARAGVIDYPALPGLIESAGALATRTIDEARAELAGIVAHHLAIEARAGEARSMRRFGADEALAIGKGLAPLAVAGVLLAALPALATTTTVTMFGLMTTSTVALPVVAAGAAGVGALGYFGVINLASLRAGQERVLIDAIEATIEARLLSPRSGAEEPSLLARVHGGLAATADEIVGTIP